MVNLNLHLIMNRNAGSGNAAKSADLVISALNEKGILFSTYSTNYPGHAIEIVQDLLETTLKPWNEADGLSMDSFPLVVVLGGDGTLHEVVNTIGQQFTIPIAYIPCGSGNDFARGVSLSREPLKALDHLLKTDFPQAFQMIHYEEQNQEESGYATNNIGIGIDAAIVAQSNRSASKEALNKFKIGSLTYLFIALQVLTKQKGFPLMVETNGKTIAFDKAFLCTTSNHPYFGGGVAIAPTANPKSASLDLVIVERIHLLKIIGIIGKLLRKKHMSSKYVHHFRSTNIRLVSTSSQFGQADGEEMGLRPFDISFTTKERLFWL